MKNRTFLSFLFSGFEAVVTIFILGLLLLCLYWAISYPGDAYWLATGFFLLTFSVYLYYMHRTWRGRTR